MSFLISIASVLLIFVWIWHALDIRGACFRLPAVLMPIFITASLTTDWVHGVDRFGMFILLMFVQMIVGALIDFDKRRYRSLDAFLNR